MIAWKQGNQNPQNNIITSFSFTSMCKCTCNSCSNHLPQRSEILTQQSNWTSQRQPRSQGTLSTSRKYPGCGWSRVYVYKSNPHRGWIIDFILSTLSMEVKVVLLFFRSWKLKASCFRDPAWPVLQSFLSKLLWVWDVDWEGSLCIFTTFLNNCQQPASDL